MTLIPSFLCALFIVFDQALAAEEGITHFIIEDESPNSPTASRLCKKSSTSETDSKSGQKMDPSFEFRHFLPPFAVSQSHSP
jgi:hypothetical protein